MHSCFLALLSLVSLVTAFDKQPYHKNTCGFTVMGYVENNYLLFFIAFFFHLSHRKKKKHSYLGKAPRSLRPQSWICWALVRIRLFSFCVLADSGDSQLPWEDWGLGLVFVSTSLGLSSAALPVSSEHHSKKMFTGRFSEQHLSVMAESMALVSTV